MKNRQTISLTVALTLLAAVLFVPSVMAETASSVTGAGAAAFPSGAVLNGASLSTMRFGIGVDIAGDGSAIGGFQTTLRTAQARSLVVDGTALSGTSAADGTRTISGTCSLDAGDGTAPATGLPFTLTITRGADGKSALGLVVGGTALPSAAVTRGTISIK